MLYAPTSNPILAHRDVLAVLLSLMVRKDIDLRNPQLGSELLRDAKGDLPLDVWLSYCPKVIWDVPLLNWHVNPSKRIDPQQAVDEAFTWAVQALVLLKSDQPAQAIEPAKRAVNILARASSDSQPKRGQPAEMRPTAVRAYVIRKYNPHPTKPKESAVSWAQLADLLFLENGKCPRCRRTRHQYNSACANALSTAERNLRSAMKRAGIPV